MKKFPIQNILFPKECALPKRDLYFKEISNGIDFFSYFNIFSARKWSKYTQADNFNLSLKINGTSTLVIYIESLSESSILHKQTFHDEINVSLPYAECVEGIIGFSLIDLSKDFEFISGNYFTFVDDLFASSINLGIAICTFKREKYLLKNLQVFQENFLQCPDSPLYNHLNINVADNGNTLLNAEIKYTASLDNHIRIFPNINAGGSAGFTRCIIEFLKKQSRPSHILLMDDDATFDPESIFRTYSLLSLIRSEYQHDFIGGAMFKEENPNIQNENGALWDSNRGAGPYFFGRDLNLTQRKSIILNDKENTANYNAWFFCCMPTSTFEKNGLPLPFFIHFDDIEYGIRCSKKIIQLNGICVWHPTANKYSPNMRFYDTRNGIITGILHNSKRHLRRTILFQALKSFVDSMISYRYIDWKMHYTACKNVFLEKNECLKKDPQKLHAQIFEPKYQIVPLSEIKCHKEIISELERIQRRSYVETLGFRQIINALISCFCLLIPSYKGNLCTINSTPPFYAPLFRGRKKIFIHISGTENCFLLERSTKKTLRSFIQLMNLMWIIFFNYSKTEKKFKMAKTEITSLDFWTKYLQLDK